MLLRFLALWRVSLLLERTLLLQMRRSVFVKETELLLAPSPIRLRTSLVVVLLVFSSIVSKPLVIARLELAMLLSGTFTVRLREVRCDSKVLADAL